MWKVFRLNFSKIEIQKGEIKWISVKLAAFREDASREREGEIERESLDKASIFASVKAGCARCSGALREEGRGTMHADPYSGRCYFRSILSIEEGRRTTWRASRLCNEPLVFNARLAETRDPPCMRLEKKRTKKK